MTITRNFSILAEGASSAGVLAVANGGTGASSLVGAGLPVWLGSLTAASSASLNFTSFISATYSKYVFVLKNLQPANAGDSLISRISEDNGGTWKSGSANYSWGYYGINQSTGGATAASNVSDTSLKLVNSSSGFLNRSICGEVTLFNPNVSSTNKSFNTNMQFTDNASGAPCSVIGGGFYYGDTNAINAVQFFFSSGNITVGTIDIWGYK